MQSRAKIFVCALAAAGTLAASSLALAQQPTKAEQAIKYRQSVYQVILWNLGPMGAAVQGKAPFEAKAFADQAQRVATMAPMLAEAYGADTFVQGKTRAKQEIWQNKADFDAKMRDFVQASASFAEVAKSGDQAKIKAAFGPMTQTCKACHDKYRSE
jgi:cytochrome c556